MGEWVDEIVVKSLEKLTTKKANMNENEENRQELHG